MAELERKDGTAVATRALNRNLEMMSGSFFEQTRRVEYDIPASSQ